MTQQTSEQVSKDCGAEVECAASQREVPGSTPGQQFQTEPPKLRYQGEETPYKRDAKRPFTELSPVSEADYQLNSEDMWKAITEKIRLAINNVIPSIVENIVAEVQSTLKATVDHSVEEAVECAKGEIYSKIYDDIGFMEAKVSLKAQCEAEVLEQYNRRDNLKVFGMPEDSAENTIKKVISLCSHLDAQVDERDISIAHRLPTRNGRVKPIIVKFSRRVAKIDIMKKKKKLREEQSDIRVFDDLTKPRTNFFNLMKTDKNLASVWTKEGVIFYKWHDNERVYKLNNLYDGGIELGYNVDDVLSCFRR